jgi:hypothetical protein
MNFVGKLLIIFLLMITKAYCQEISNAKDFCKTQKGVWREFGDDCADSCSLERGSGKSCIKKITYSCDCLENKCWDYYQCIDDDLYQKQEKEAEKERIKNLEDSNPELFNFFKNQTTQVDRFTQKSNNNNNKNISIEEQVSSCKSDRGIWKKFSNACADQCISRSNSAICASVITDSCDCGQNRCWNGESCINDVNDLIKTPF